MNNFLVGIDSTGANIYEGSIIEGQPIITKNDRICGEVFYDPDDFRFCVRFTEQFSPPLYQVYDILVLNKD